MKTYINLKELSEAYNLTKERFSKDLVTIEEVIDALDETLELLEKEKQKIRNKKKSGMKNLKKCYSWKDALINWEHLGGKYGKI